VQHTAPVQYKSYVCVCQVSRTLFVQACLVLSFTLAVFESGELHSIGYVLAISVESLLKFLGVFVLVIASVVGVSLCHCASP